MSFEQVTTQPTKSAANQASAATEPDPQRPVRPPEDQLDVALRPVATPVPKPAAKKASAPVRTDHAPTVGEILDPQRPALDGASDKLVLDSIEGLVKDIYDQVLNSHLTLLQASLAKAAPPPETPFALALLGWVVETVAAWTIGSIGKLAAKQLFGQPESPPASSPLREPTPVEQAMGKDPNAQVPAPAPTTSVPTTAEDGMTQITAAAGRTAGAALGHRITSPRPTTAPPAGTSPIRAAPGETLLVEFITRQQAKLLEKKHDAITTLRLLASQALGSGRTDLVDLDSALRTLIGSPELGMWFEHKVTMEWLNFVARASLGPREKGQDTDMIGANTIGGISAGGAKANQQWNGAEGFVEITLTAPDTIDGLRGVALQNARIPSSYGAALKLKDADSQVDQSGTPYNLATLPVYRRVWLQTGTSKLTESPAFVITPDGEIEADVGNPVLAAIGSGHPVEVGETTYYAGADRFGVDEHKDPAAWARRAVASNLCVLGAHLIREMLRGVKPEVLQ